MSGEMKYFFKKMRKLFVMVGVHLLATLIAEFAGKLIAAVFTSYGLGHEEGLYIQRPYLFYVFPVVA